MSGVEFALYLLRFSIAKYNLAIQSATEIANGMIVVLLSNHKCGILFRTNTYIPSMQATNRAGGMEKIIPKEWERYELGYVWLGKIKRKMGVSELISGFISKLLIKIDGSDIDWYDLPAPINPKLFLPDKNETETEIEIPIFADPFGRF